MKIVISMVFVLLITAHSISGESSSGTVFVSLGRYCEGAHELSVLGLRKASYPFDWLVTLNFDSVCRLIKNKFKDFLNPAYLTYENYEAVNTLYGVSFRHDFPVTNFLSALDSVSAKYARRCERFLKLLDGSVQIVFLRTRATPQDAQQFVDMMQANYPLADYQLLVIHGDKDLDFNWDIPRVKSFYATKQGTLNPNFGWFHTDEWRDMLIKFRLVQPTPAIMSAGSDDGWVGYFIEG